MTSSRSSISDVVTLKAMRFHARIDPLTAVTAGERDQSERMTIKPALIGLASGGG